MSRRVCYDVNGNEVYDDAPTYTQDRLVDIEHRRVAKDVLPNESIDKLEEAKRLLNEANGKLEEVAKIFCNVLHGKDDCYKECPAFTEGWTKCYIEDSFSNIDMISEKIDCLLKSCGEKKEKTIMEKNIDELNDYIEKYQMALKLASVDIVK